MAPITTTSSTSILFEEDAPHFTNRTKQDGYRTSSSSFGNLTTGEDPSMVTPIRIARKKWNSATAMNGGIHDITTTTTAANSSSSHTALGSSSSNAGGGLAPISSTSILLEEDVPHYTSRARQDGYRTSSSSFGNLTTAEDSSMVTPIRIARKKWNSATALNGDGSHDITTTTTAATSGSSSTTALGSSTTGREGKLPIRATPLVGNVARYGGNSTDDGTNDMMSFALESDDDDDDDDQNDDSDNNHSRSVILMDFKYDTEDEKDIIIDHSTDHKTHNNSNQDESQLQLSFDCSSNYEGADGFLRSLHKQSSAVIVNHDGNASVSSQSSSISSRRHSSLFQNGGDGSTRGGDRKGDTARGLFASLTKLETQRIKGSKYCLLAFIYLIATIVSILTYVTLHNNDVTTTNEMYDQNADVITDSIQHNIFLLFEAHRSFSKEITSDLLVPLLFPDKKSNITIMSPHQEDDAIPNYPYVTFPTLFETYANNMRGTFPGRNILEMTTYAPYVSNNDLLSYIEFSTINSTTIWYPENVILHQQLQTRLSNQPSRRRRNHRALDATTSVGTNNNNSTNSSITSSNTNHTTPMIQRVIYNTERIVDRTDTSGNHELIRYVPYLGNQYTYFVPTLYHSPPPTNGDTMYPTYYFQNINMLSLFPSIQYINDEQITVNIIDVVNTINDIVFTSFDKWYAVLVNQYYGEERHTIDESSMVNYEDDDQTLPHSIMIQPIHQQMESMISSGVTFHNHNHYYHDRHLATTNSTSVVVGYLFSTISWDAFLYDLLPDNMHGIYVVLQNSCQQSYTFMIQGTSATYIGDDDLHETKYNKNKRTIDLSDNYLDPELAKQTLGHCMISFDLYSSQEFESSYKSNTAIYFTIVVIGLFTFIALLLLVYDKMVEMRTNKVAGQAARSNNILASLFPTNVRDRLLAEKQLEQEQEKKQKKSHLDTTAHKIAKYRSRFNKPNTVKGYLTEMNNHDMNGDGNSDHGSVMSAGTHYSTTLYVGTPIADLFPYCTVFFGDIAGFTAWSSVREPTQVFILLETLYHAFDAIANRRRVFKVETIGDCYVAVCGLPDPRKDHAVNMCRFAKSCMEKTWVLTKRLEKMLGPDTGDLTMRMGLHSGPVTAGVLRGERSRFQLFGDTVNYAARMEGSGKRDRIHISQETSDLLTQAGKTNWFTPRLDAKDEDGKLTYWLKVNNDDPLDKGSQHSGLTEKSENAYRIAGFVARTANGGGVTLSQTLSGQDVASSFATANAEALVAKAATNEKAARLIEWNTDVLLRLLKQVVARREVIHRRNSETMVNFDLIARREQEISNPEHQRTVLDEVKEIIELPEYDSRASKHEESVESIVLGSKVEEQLHDYVTSIGAGYQDNPFHNFEHAAHVTMSVVKLLSRIVAPSEYDMDRDQDRNAATSLHDHTYGITSDPLTQFACVLSALIHDLDHPGVPNAQLVKECIPLANFYKNQSVAEQNSVDIAWRMLMDPKYTELRSAIYADECELTRFRQLIVNSVMATDIVDKELKALRNARWEKAFSQEETNQLDNERDQINRKATIVIEHLIQASDVAHTMQHWHIYRKWNERFFLECYQAYKTGRAETDPSINWYNGEIGFFDFYIIPLAKKLKDCGVFGVSSAEYLNYAMKNRKEWENRGKEVVDEMVEKARILWDGIDANDLENIGDLLLGSP